MAKPLQRGAPFLMSLEKVVPLSFGLATFPKLAKRLQRGTTFFQVLQKVAPLSHGLYTFSKMNKPLQRGAHVLRHPKKGRPGCSSSRLQECSSHPRDDLLWENVHELLWENYDLLCENCDLLWENYDLPCRGKVTRHE